MNWILHFKDDPSLFSQYGGGKARNLAKLSRMGAPVPPWFCVSTEVYRFFIQENNLESLVRVDPKTSKDQLAEIAARIEESFLNAVISKEVHQAVWDEVSKNLGGDAALLAVRSSGLDEDSAQHSFAGQFSSYLFQRGERAVFESLRRCWASGFSERALAYRIERGIPLDSIQVGVVIQQMVDGESAGVAFSRNPMRPLDRDSLVISSVYGLGEGLVSGELDADHFNVDRKSLEIHSQIVKKEVAFRRNEKGGLIQAPIPESLQSISSLSGEQVKEIARMAIHLEESLRGPQDCEWVYAQGKLYWVQTRPVTSLPKDSMFDETLNSRTPILWDNSNIIESFCGVTSPLTFSHVSRAYRQVYLQFCELMGVPEEVVRKHEPTFRNMLGLIRGRVYYNLGSWYQMLFLFPGTASNKGFMETMMGVKQGLKPEIASLFDFTKNPPRYSFFLKIRLLVLTLLRVLRVRGIIERFNSEVGEIYRKAYQTRFQDMSLQQQLDYYFMLEREILGRWKAPIISDTRCMVYFGLLKSLTAKWIGKGDEFISLQNDLLCGQGDLASTEPTRALMKIASEVDSGDPTFRQWFVRSSPQEAWQGLAEGGRSHKILERFRDFLDRYGFRCMNELKLEEHDLHDNPCFAIDSVIRYVKMKNYSIEEMEKRERVIRDRAEKLALGKLSPLRRWVYWKILDRARIAVKDREDLRFMRTKTFGVTRRLFRAIGTNLHKMDLIDNPEDIFYLTTDEVVSFNEGRALSLDFRKFVTLRKAEFEEYKRTPPPPDRLITLGAAGLYLRNPQILAQSDLLAAELPKSDDPNTLIGTPCCPGAIEGVVRVVKDPEDAVGLEGEILVTERTDPGWVPLFPSCSGLLIERGSLLSHSAVVARELGLPTIVGISGGLLKRLKTGQRVRMDATRGVVTILDGEENEKV